MRVEMVVAHHSALGVSSYILFVVYPSHGLVIIISIIKQPNNSPYFMIA